MRETYRLSPNVSMQERDDTMIAHIDDDDGISWFRELASYFY